MGCGGQSWMDGIWMQKYEDEKSLFHSKLSMLKIVSSAYTLKSQMRETGDEEVIIRGSDRGWQASSCSADSRMCLTGKNENVLNVEKWVLSI